MKILVVDDEPLAQQRLQNILESMRQVSQVYTTGNGAKAISLCQQQQMDLVLLDIRMPGIDGLETAQHLSQMDKPPAIIFTTAYDEYALEAFKVSAVDYLLKPVREQKLIEAIDKASRLNRVQLQAIKSQPSGRLNITAKISGNIKLIPVADIFYFLAEQKYVTVKYQQGETIIEDTLKDLQAEFEEDFIRVHRNALVAKKFINGVHKTPQGHTYITLESCDTEVEISRRHLSTVKKLIARL